MSMPKHIFIVGAAGSGKTEFARMLAGELGTLPVVPRRNWRVAECGDLLIRRLANIQAHGRWPQPAPADQWVTYIRSRKEEYREQLRAIGDQLAVDAPGRLLDECADNAEIVVGARRKAEAVAYYGGDAWILRDGDTWIHVARPGRADSLGSDSRRLANDSFDREFFEKFCAHQVINRGDLAALEKEAALLAAMLTA